MLIYTQTNNVRKAARTVAQMLDAYEFPDAEREAMRWAHAALCVQLHELRTYLAQACSLWFERQQ